MKKSLCDKQSGRFFVVHGNKADMLRRFEGRFIADKFLSALALTSIVTEGEGAGITGIAI
jgi:hypothetical protein